ncbi:hypothetical protein N431DRAFT_502118 [Stipitochalara longipes BDJ]|nr:hypothetical protein N431DRAFT_502118 [Stipitochalara longipes BDJ]
MELSNTLPCPQEAFEPFQLSLASDQSHDWSIWSQDPPPPIKRSPVMSGTQRRLHDNRIKQLYVDEGRSIDDVCTIVNREFNLTAKRRHYVHRIRVLNIERNAKAQERQKVVQHINYLRYAAGTQESYIEFRIRGHKIDSPKWYRWLKDDSAGQPAVIQRPPSPLPRFINVYTCSPYDFQRINRYAGHQSHTLDPQEARDVFQVLQIILGCKSSSFYKRDTIVEECIIQVQNSLTGRIFVENALSSTNSPRKRDVDNRSCRYISAAQRTPYWMVETSFWIDQNYSHPNFGNESIGTIRLDSARIAIVPRETTPFRIVFDFAPQLNLPTTIKYQPIVRNSSEVFRIVGSGQISVLQRAIENGNASLGDRDEQGRPLLYYAALGANVEMCQYLIGHHADVNELVESDEIIGPVYSMALPISISSEKLLRHKMSRCLKVMLDAGADLSLKSQKSFSSYTVFYLGLLFYSFETFEHMVLSEQQFVCPKEFFEDLDGQKRYSLHLLAEQCGYGLILESFDIVEKAILLLKHDADISRPDVDGCTISSTRRGRDFRQRIRSLHEPKEFLIASITAGANVYAIDADGLTPSMYARMFRREMEWLEALRSIGYDPEEVIAHSDPDFHICFGRQQGSRVSFEEYCLQRERDFESRKSEIFDGGDEDISENEDDSEDSTEDDDDSEEVFDDGGKVTGNKNENEYGNHLSPIVKEHENTNTKLLRSVEICQKSFVLFDLASIKI